jgi:hypothetical protein
VSEDPTFNERIDALVPIFAALTRALRDAKLPDLVRRRAFAAVEAMGRDVGTPAFATQLAALSVLLELHPELGPVVEKYLPQFARLLH